MANEVLIKVGTALTWKATGGDYAITLASLAADGARQGAKGDLGATRAARFAARMQLALAAAPTNGAVVELWWSSSTSGTAATDNTGACSGADAAYVGTTGGDTTNTKLQLLLIGYMPVTADTGSVTQRCEFVFSPPQRYGMPVVVNSAGQALSTATHQIMLVPMIDEVQ
jgi:hypothetical protein